MPASALALVVAAALIHALWNFAAKKAQGNHHFACMTALGVSLLWLPAMGIGTSSLVFGSTIGPTDASARVSSLRRRCCRSHHAIRRSTSSRLGDLGATRK